MKGQSPYQLGCSAVLEVRTSAIITAVKALGPIGTSIRQVELLQQSGVSPVSVQALQEGVHFRLDQIVTMHSGSSVQPLKRFVGLVSESINLGDQILTACMLFPD